MPQQIVNLNTLLSWLIMPDKEMKQKVRESARSYVAKQKNLRTGGGDFYVPFWRDAKNHLAGIADLQEATKLRIDQNKGRTRLYSLLAEKFSIWWEEKRRWTNEGVSVVYMPVKGNYQVQQYDALVKVHNLLTIQIGEQPLKSFYPYFTESAPLSEDMAKMALWILQEAIPNALPEQLRILDVLRYKSYSQKKHPLTGNEEQRFLALYSEVNKHWEKCCEEFNDTL